MTILDGRAVTLEQLIFPTSCRKTYQYVCADKEEAVVGLELHNPVAMESACGTPPFTNYTPGFSGCIDYIFYEKSNLKVHQVNEDVASLLCESSTFYFRLCRFPVWKM